MKRLVVAEKNIAARKIADFLSGGGFRRETLGKVPTYHFMKDGDEWAVMDDSEGYRFSIDGGSWRSFSSDLLVTPSHQ